MKIEFIKDKLQKAINQAERSVGKNLSLPILSNIILETENKKLIVKSTNLEIGVEIEVAAKIEGDLKVAVNPSLLNNLLQNLPNNEKIEINKEEDLFIINTNKGQVNLKTQTTEDFPIIPKVTSDKVINITIKNFIEGIKSVAYAAALSDIKPEIASVYLYSEDQKLFFVSTDGFRLSEKFIILDNFSPKELINLIIPLKNALEINRILSDQSTDGELVIMTDNNQISIMSDGLHITSRIIDGVYPDYRQVMPKDLKTRIELNKNDFINTLKLAGVFSDKFNRLTIDVNKEIVTLSTKNNETGESTLKITPRAYSGEGLSLTISSRYLLDALQSINDEYIILGFNESNKPLYLKGFDDVTFQGLVMPLRT